MWLQTSNPYLVRVFTGAAPGHMAFMGPNMLTEQDIGISATDRTFGLEGVFPGTTVFTLKLRDATDAVICQDSVTVTVVQLWVFWETTGGQQILEANNHPTAGIGVKYYADATTPGGGWNDMVQVRVWTDAPVAGARVHFKAFDPDDPSAYDNVVDNDPQHTGGDNRDTGHGDTAELSATSAVTDAVGDAVVQFRLAHQPGDNHRIAATLKQSALNTLTDNNVPPSGTHPGHANQIELFCGKLSPLLTVWRRLWVERDTMATPQPSELRVTGTVDSIARNTPVPGQATVDLGQNLPDEFSDLNLYEEGRIQFVGCPAGSDTFSVIESTSHTGADDSVVILGVPAVCAHGSVYLLWDDDNPTVLPHYPDGGQLLVSAFAEAYILPFDAGAQYQDVVEFTRHLSDWAVEYGLGAWDDARDLQSTASSWACLIVGCWEADEDWDGDPDLCFALTPPFVARPGAEGVETCVTDGDSGRTAIYTQALADDAACMAVTDEVHTVTHEIGHTCGDHPQHIPQSLMEVGAPRTQNRFSPESMNIFRNQDTW